LPNENIQNEQWCYIIDTVAYKDEQGKEDKTFSNVAVKTRFVVRLRSYRRILSSGICYHVVWQKFGKVAEECAALLSGQETTQHHISGDTTLLSFVIHKVLLCPI
jgi:hypothetical protein